MRLTLLLLLLLANGCDAPGDTPPPDDTTPGGDTEPRPPSDSRPSDADDPWGDGGTRPDVGPFSQLEVFRSGCGDQLWLRFVPTEDFGLLELRAQPPTGGAQTQTWFEVPVFLSGEPSYHLALEAGGYEPGSYDLELRVRTRDDATRTYTATLPAAGLPREPGIITLDSVRQNAGGAYDATITPQIDGDLRQIFLYEADTECRVASFQRFSGEPLARGTTTETSLGSPGLDQGDDYLVVFRGVDTSRDYIYYATGTFTAP